MNATEKLHYACKVANCDCGKTGEMTVSSKEADWACVYEFWTTQLKGHLIAASLILDGVAIEDLP